MKTIAVVAVAENHHPAAQLLAIYDSCLITSHFVTVAIFFRLPDFFVEKKLLSRIHRP
jgi:hypothetical protein